MNNRKNIVGEIINFRGLIYSPINEQGVVFLFGKVAHEFGMYVEVIRTHYPDCVAKRFIGKGRWEEINIEFEYKSSAFKSHLAKAEETDMVVCWEHDWDKLPKHIEVLELKEEIKKLENVSVETPDKISKSSEYDVAEHLKRVPKQLGVLFQETDRRILLLGDKVYNKAAKYRIYYYSPKRVFASIKLMQSGLNIVLFTNAKKIKGVEPLGNNNYAQKWGRVYVKDRKDVTIAINALKKSLGWLNYCVDNNLKTGWYAEAED